MAMTITAAPHFTWRHLYASMPAAQTPTSKLWFVTSDKESSINTSWQEKEFKQIRSRESQTEKAATIEKNVLSERERNRTQNFDPTTFYGKSFLESKARCIVINKNPRTLYILEFKRSSDRNENFLGVQK